MEHRSNLKNRKEMCYLSTMDQTLGLLSSFTLPNLYMIKNDHVGGSKEHNLPCCMDGVGVSLLLL